MDFFNHYKNEVYLQQSECQLFDLKFLSEKLYYKLSKLRIELIIVWYCIHGSLINGQETLLNSQNITVSYSTTCQKFWEDKGDMISVFSGKLWGFILYQKPIELCCKKKRVIFLFCGRRQRIEEKIFGIRLLLKISTSVWLSNLMFCLFSMDFSFLLHYCSIFLYKNNFGKSDSKPSCSEGWKVIYIQTDL